MYLLLDIGGTKTRVAVTRDFKKIKLSELRAEQIKISTPFKGRPVIRKSSLGDLNGIYGAMAYLLARK